jgi:hypothetical protein
MEIYAEDKSSPDPDVQEFLQQINYYLEKGVVWNVVTEV